jgi:hypothetical protein
VAVAIRARRGAQGGALQTATALLLIAVTLAPSLLGRAGFQQIEAALAARIFVLHQHGVPGEAEYIREFGLPAPFVHPHCHAPTGPRSPNAPGAFDLGSLLFGSVVCGTVLLVPLPPAAVQALVGTASGASGHAEPRPLTPPPRG